MVEQTLLLCIAVRSRELVVLGILGRIEIGLDTGSFNTDTCMTGE